MVRVLKNVFRIFISLFILLNIITAFHAYKFTHYYEPGEVLVTEINKKSIWNHAKEMFFGFNFVKKKITVTPDTAFKKVLLKTKNNLKLEAWFKQVLNSKGTVVLFHGHGGNKSDVLSEANEFMKMGYNVFLPDFRAHGNSEGNTCTIGFNEAEDVKLAYDFVRATGEKNVVLWGISLGAATITRCVSAYGIVPEKIILELPFASIEQAVKARLRMMSLPVQPLATLLTFWGGVENNFWAFNHKPALYVKKINCPVLLQFAKNDTRVTEKERKDITENIAAPKRLVIYENSGHESLCKNENTKWVETVSLFLK